VITTHKTLGPEHFERLRAEAVAFVKKTEGMLANRKGDRQACHDFLCHDSLRLACMALILKRGDREADVHFKAAARHALEWLRAPGSVGEPRVYDVNLYVSDSGVRAGAIDERPASHVPRKLSLSDFSMILLVTAAFGDVTDFDEVARFPEDSYRNSNVIESPEAYAQMRTLKAWLRHEGDDARREAEGVLAVTKAPVIQAGVGALLAMMVGDTPGFQQHLDERLTQHKKQYRRLPNDPLGIVCVHGMALCRLAVERQLEVTEGPYLPLRFLPNWSSHKAL
jgi:hypothetical protein